MNSKKVFALLLALITFSAGLLRFNSEYTYRILDHTTEINRKQRQILKMREAGLLENQQMYIGADMNVIADMQKSNTDSKFGYLMRHPTQNNQVGKFASEFVIHDAKFQVTGTLTPWITMYFHAVYNPEQSFGSGTITDVERNQLSLQRGYVLLGDLSRFPIYGSIGKMAIPFGLTDTVNPFTASTVWHAFGGLAYGGLIGYDKGGLNLSFMAIQGGAQFRAANSGDDIPDDVANFTINGSYEFAITETATLLIGGGYIDGSAYCQPFSVTHFNGSDGFNNPAWDAYAVLNWGRFTLMAEFAETTEVWPGTHNPNPPLDVFKAHKVSSFDIGIKYLVPIDFLAKDLGVSVDFSQFTAGPSGSPWKDQKQFTVGLDMFWNNNAKFFAEYIRIEGYVPLNFISGPDPFDPSKALGTTPSDSNATSDVFIIGIRVAI